MSINLYHVEVSNINIDVEVVEKIEVKVVRISRVVVIRAVKNLI